MVCNSSYEYIAVYEIQLRLSGLMIELLGPLTIVNISNSLSLSNFIHVESMIFFAADNIIVVMDVLDSSRTQKYPELPQCAQIYKLTPIKLFGAINEQALVAYCPDKYFYFDLVFGDWVTTQHFQSNVVQYICPFSDYEAKFFINSTTETGFLQFSASDSENTINHVNISSGICLNKTYFAYSDQQHNNIYVYDFSTQNHYPVSHYDCSHIHQDCPQLFVLENEYLVIGDVNYDIVLDTQSNFSLIINISSSIADILVVLHGNNHSAITPSPPITHSRSTTTVKVPSSTNLISTFISIPNYTHATSLPTHATSITLHSTLAGGDRQF